jgi:hypothetical protein
VIIIVIEIKIIEIKIDNKILYFVQEQIQIPTQILTQIEIETLQQEID